MTLVASVVMLIMQAVMTMMMPCARAAQQRHRAIEELLVGHRAVLVGIVLSLVVMAMLPGGMVLGALLALAGLWVYEDLWIRAGQSIPLS